MLLLLVWVLVLGWCCCCCWCWCWCCCCWWRCWRAVLLLALLLLLLLVAVVRVRESVQAGRAADVRLDGFLSPTDNRVPGPDVWPRVRVPRARAWRPRFVVRAWVRVSACASNQAQAEQIFAACDWRENEDAVMEINRGAGIFFAWVRGVIKAVKQAANT
jgi:hypothetical protein